MSAAFRHRHFWPHHLVWQGVDPREAHLFWDEHPVYIIIKKTTINVTKTCLRHIHTNVRIQYYDITYVQYVHTSSQSLHLTRYTPSYRHGTTDSLWRYPHPWSNLANLTKPTWQSMQWSSNKKYPVSLVRSTSPGQRSRLGWLAWRKHWAHPRYHWCAPRTDSTTGGGRSEQMGVD